MPSDSDGSSRIVVALDGMDGAEMFALVTRLRGRVWGWKVNDGLLDGGAASLEWLKGYGGLFLDPKLHDIPNTVHNQVRRLVVAGADLITCHASGGLEMLRAAVDAGGERILGVTALTSLGDDDLDRIYGVSRVGIVSNLAGIALDAGCWGVVCAAGDLVRVPAGLRTVVPGYRPQGLLPGDDQKVTGGSREVRGATLVVVGRPITRAADPVQVVDQINADLATDTH
jgi:orotidine-5'-phosphate decarboxylase